MGIHRNLIHPKFGSFILLGTVLIDREVRSDTYPIDYNPCFECNLCVASCPVGAIGSDGSFNFSACYTHNYREFMGGFTDWVEQIADSKNALDYRKRISEPETASMWQSLSFGPNYKSAYCLGVCPAGEDVIGPFLTNRKGYLEEVVKPLQDKEETVYVVAGSDAEGHVKKRFKNKRVKQVGNALRPRTIRAFLDGLPHVFERNQSEGLDATYHFTFTGQEQRQATIVIRNKALQVEDGHVGVPSLRVTADTRTWLGFLAKERNLVWALLTRKIRLKGSPKLLVAFGKCFPAPSYRHAPAAIPAPTDVLREARIRPTISTLAFIGKQPRWSGTLRVDAVRDETLNVKTFRLVNPAGGNIPFSYLPGQFLTLAIEPGGKPTKRSYTIASTPTRPDAIEITVKREDHGLVSRYLHDEIKIGTTLNLSAPSGTFTFTGGEHDSIVLIAGGVGITPMMSVVRYLTDQKWAGDIFLLISHRSPSDYIFREEIEALSQRHANLRVITTMSRPDGAWSGLTGRITKELVNDSVPSIASRRIHICGPVPMMDDVKSMLTELQVRLEQIKIEAFGTVKRKPTPPPVEAPVAVPCGSAGSVTFTLSGKCGELSPDKTILDIADQVGVEIDNSCRSGTCGSCKVKLLSGNVTMEVEDALDQEEKAEGIILGCQAKAERAVVVEA
jgi:ferredoxin-NADP reductase/ferredoxin